MHYNYNPFESIDARLSRIEALLSDQNWRQHTNSVLPTDEGKYGNFKWYLSETGEAESSARQRIAHGELPGVTKLGKRLIFEKAVIRQWIKDNQRKTEVEISEVAEALFNQRHAHRAKGGAIK